MNMLNKKNIEWTPCSSKNEMISRLKENFFLAELDEARDWGFFHINENSTLAIGYTDYGIKPSAFKIEGHIIFGAGQYVAKYDPSEKGLTYQYKVPTVFHEFITLDKYNFLIRDEICFILINDSGDEIWSFCPGLIDKYTLNGTSIEGATDEGIIFKTDLPL